MMTVGKDGSIVGTVGGGNLELSLVRHAPEALSDGGARRLHYGFRGGAEQNVEKACCGTTDFFVQPFLETPRLIISGAAHASRALVPLALSCGFSGLIVDDRRGHLEPPSVPPGTTFHHGPFAEKAVSVTIDPSTYVVSMTYGHAHDETVLAACLDQPWRYLGFMGSRAKVATLKARLGITAEARPHSRSGRPRCRRAVAGRDRDLNRG